MARDPDADKLPEPDRAEGAPHPRETAELFGHARAESSFLQAYNAGRLHHGWLLTGPKGVGKATLAWRIAKFLLATPPDEGGMFAPTRPDRLAISPDHPVARRIAALSEPRLYLLRRGPNDKGDALARDITVGEVRKLKAFFGLSAADGGRRVAIIDAADEMNSAASNALLKLLEEPPADVTMLLVAHQPARLLPTIRSRCRVLQLGALGADDMARALAQAQTAVEAPEALAELSLGSVGAALRISALDGVKIYKDIISLLGQRPRMDRAKMLALAEGVSGKGREARFDLTLELIDLALARLARAGATATLPLEAVAGEAEVLARLNPSPRHALIWADLAQNLGLRARTGRAVNLDPAALLLDMLMKIDEAAQGI